MYPYLVTSLFKPTQISISFSKMRLTTLMHSKDWGGRGGAVMGHPEIYAYMVKEISHNCVKYESSTNYFIIIIIFCIGGFLE